MARPKKNNAIYFSHDADMRNDNKIKAVRRKFNIEGYGIWCMILEHLTDTDYFKYEYNDLNLELLAGDFDVDPTTLKDVFEYCIFLKLLINEDGYVYSQKLIERFDSLLNKRKRDIKPPTDELSTPITPQVEVIDIDYPHSKVKEIIVDENKEYNINNNPLPPKKLAIKKVKTFSEEVYNCFYEILNYFPEQLHPDTDAKKDNWLNTIRLLSETDLIPFETIIQITKSAREDGFWSTVFLALPKLRTNDKNGIKYIVVLNEKFKNKNDKQTKMEKISEMANQIRETQHGF